MAEYKLHKVSKPWGHFQNLVSDKNYLVKIIYINKGHELSLQRHKHRDEHWVILEGECEVKRNNEKILMTKNDYIFIEKESVHTVKNVGNMTVKILEVQFGEYISEDDIERLTDPYKRDI